MGGLRHDSSVWLCGLCVRACTRIGGAVDEGLPERPCTRESPRLGRRPRHGVSVGAGPTTSSHSATLPAPSDHPSTSPCPPPVQVLYAARDWKGLQEYVVLLSKRRSQLKQAVQAMVRQCMGYIADTPDKAS